MRPQDKLVFAACAATLQVWILVRRTNPASLGYIGLRGFTPKPINCKAKTADFGPFAGLVIDPSIIKDAYSDSKLPDALNCWEDFSRDVLTSTSGYSVQKDPASKYHGCVLLDGNCIYGDYDLYDVVDPKQARRNFAIVDTLHGQLHMRSPWLDRVLPWLNSRIGAPVVQHSGEAQYKDHSDQTLDVFGPRYEYRELHNEAQTRSFYSAQFEGRKALGKGVRW